MVPAKCAVARTNRSIGALLFDTENTLGAAHDDLLAQSLEVLLSILSFHGGSGVSINMIVNEVETAA